MNLRFYPPNLKKFDKKPIQKIRTVTQNSQKFVEVEYEQDPKTTSQKHKLDYEKELMKQNFENCKLESHERHFDAIDLASPQQVQTQYELFGVHNIVQKRSKIRL